MKKRTIQVALAVIFIIGAIPMKKSLLKGFRAITIFIIGKSSDIGGGGYTLSCLIVECRLFFPFFKLQIISIIANNKKNLKEKPHIQACNLTRVYKEKKGKNEESVRFGRKLS